MIRTSRPSDLPGIAALWQEAFGDSPNAVAAFFAHFPQCRSYVAEDDGKIVSMVHALPRTLSPNIPTAYIYAVATAKTHRGRGLCRRLMAFAEAELEKSGIHTTVLTPGEPPLFRFYEDLGYRTAFFRSRTPFSGGEPISLPEYNRLREELLQLPHMVCTEHFLQYARTLYDLTFYKTPTGIAAAGPHFTAEVLPEDLSDAPYAMVKTAQTIPNAYLGFGLE